MNFHHVHMQVIESFEDRITQKLTVELNQKPGSCPQCGGMSLVGFGMKKGQRFFDIPQDGKRVELHVNRKRFKCKNCGRTFLEPLADMSEKRHVTKRLLIYIIDQSQQRSNLSLAHEVGLDEKTIRNIRRDLTDWRQRELTKEATRV